MCVQKIRPEDASIVSLLSKARTEGLILDSDDMGAFALLPLDDEVIDLLLERHPQLIQECQQIRERMRQGQYLKHEQVVEALR